MGLPDYLSLVKYLFERGEKQTYAVDATQGNTYMHLLCQLSEDEYVKSRTLISAKPPQELQEEFTYIQSHLLAFFKNKGLNGLQENKKKESPLKLCVENGNLIGIQILLPKKINFNM